MITDFKKNADLGEMLEALRRCGVIRIPNYLDSKNRQLLKAEADSILQNTVDDGTYKFGKAARIGSFMEHQNKNPNIYNTFSQEWMIQLAVSYLENPPKVNEIFITNEYRNNSGLERNGYLHYDRFHTFKYMIYLTDCDKESGAFSCIPGTNIEGKFLRGRNWNTTTEYGEVKNRIFIDFPELSYTKRDVVPVEGASGTLIIFDTDVFHMGGHVEDGKERLLIRSHLHDGSRFNMV